MNFNFRHNVSLTNQTSLVKKSEKSSSLFFPQITLDDFYETAKTPKPNSIVILNNSIFSKNGDSVVVT